MADTAEKYLEATKGVGNRAWAVFDGIIMRGGSICPWRSELAFHVQLGDYSRELRQEGGDVTRAWVPGPAPDEWTGRA